jgi:CRP/FNR family transcriptional regulator
MQQLELGRTYADGEFVFREGDRGDAMYVIQFGKIRIVKRTAANEVTLATLGPGEILGEMSLFDQHERSASAVAVGEARVLTVDRRKFFASMSHDPTLAFKILCSMSARIRQLNQQVTQHHCPDL